MPSEQPTVYAARPELAVDGRVHAALSAALQSLTIAEDLAGLARCDLTLNNWGPVGDGVSYLFLGRDAVDFGKPLAVRLGDASLFDGQVTAIGAAYPADEAPRLTVLADDRLQALRMTRRTRSFADVTDADVIRRVAGEHGLQTEVDLPGPTHKALAQVNLSDLAFLRERARALDAELWVDGRTLHARAHGSDRARPLELTLRRELWSFEVLADLAHQRTAVVVSGWDVAGKDAATHEANEAAIRSELGGDESGAAILAAALGARKEVLAHATPTDAGEARSRAEAAFRAIARRFVVGRGVAAPNAALRAGRKLKLSGLGDMFDGTYLLTECTFVYDLAEGLRVEFTAERPGLGRKR
jgi:phage protein D